MVTGESTVSVLYNAAASCERWLNVAIATGSVYDKNI